MKKFIHFLAKSAARYALAYAGDAAVAILDRASAKTAGRASVLRMIAHAETVANLMTLYISALKDGSVTDDERSAIADETQRIANSLKEALK